MSAKIAAIWLILMGVVGCAGNQQSAVDPLLGHGVPDGPLMISAGRYDKVACILVAVPESSIFVRGSRPIIDIWTISVGDEPCRVVRSGTLQSYDVRVFDPEGHAVPYSKYGESSAAFGGELTAVTYIQPGEFSHERYEIGDDFDFTEEGHYSIEISRRFWTSASDAPRMTFAEAAITIEPAR